MPLDFADPKVVKQVDLKSKAEQEVDDVTLTQIMNTTSGRKFIFKQLQLVFETSYSEDSYGRADPIKIAFNEGHKQPGLKLYIELMRTCPDQYVQMWREADARAIAAADESVGNKDGDGRDQGSDERQLDFYRDLASGKISIEFEPDTGGDR